MAKGQKFNEDLADELLKEADPKGDGQFAYQDFIKKIMKR
jgi:Ca2+-binding EF-hand superfamily protein